MTKYGQAMVTNAEQGDSVHKVATQNSHGVSKTIPILIIIIGETILINVKKKEPTKITISTNFGISVCYDFYNSDISYISWLYCQGNIAIRYFSYSHWMLSIL